MFLDFFKNFCIVVGIIAFILLGYGSGKLLIEALRNLRDAERYYEKPRMIDIIIVIVSISGIALVITLWQR